MILGIAGLVVGIIGVGLSFLAIRG